MEKRKETGIGHKLKYFLNSECVELLFWNYFEIYILQGQKEENLFSNCLIHAL